MTSEQVASDQLGKILSDKGLYLGPHLFGMLLDVALLGAITLLFIHWSIVYRARESRITQYLMVYLLLLSFGVSAYIITRFMQHFIYHFGEYTSFTSVVCGTKDKVCMLNRGLKWFVLIDFLAHLPVSVFFAYRASIAMDSSPTFTYVMFIVLGMSVATAAGYGTVQQKRPSIGGELFTFYLSLALAGDVVVTSTLAVLFVRSSAAKDVRRGSRWISKQLLGLCTETALIPTIITLGALIAHVVKKDNPIDMAFNFISKTYVLAALLALMREVPFHTAMMGKDGEEHDPNILDFKFARRPTVATIVPTEVDISTERFDMVHQIPKRAVHDDIPPAPFSNRSYAFSPSQVSLPHIQEHTHEPAHEEIV